MRITKPAGVLARLLLGLSLAACGTTTAKPPATTSTAKDPAAPQRTPAEEQQMQQHQMQQQQMQQQQVHQQQMQRM
jgi:hypothetical protein